MSIPKELWRMVDFLLQKGCETSGLWTDKGVEGEETIIRDALDEGTPFPSIEYVSLIAFHPSVHSMADCLLDWFISLQSPLIPEKCTSRIEKGEKINSEFVKAFMNMVRVVECD